MFLASLKRTDVRKKPGEFKIPGFLIFLHKR